MSMTTGSQLGGRWRRWLLVWTVLGSPAVFLALLFWGAATVAWVCLGAALVSGGLYVLPACDGVRASGRDHRALLRSAGTVALSGAVFSVAFGVAVQVATVAAVCLLLAVACTSPAILDRARRLFGPESSPASSAAMSPPAAEAVDRSSPLLSALLADSAEQMSNVELCRAWRRSFVALQDARSCAERAKVVALRRSYLDEMESRDAGAFEAWLASGARAAGGPERFLTDRSSGGEGHPHVA